MKITTKTACWAVTAVVLLIAIVFAFTGATFWVPVQPGEMFRPLVLAFLHIGGLLAGPVHWMNNSRDYDHD